MPKQTILPPDLVEKLVLLRERYVREHRPKAVAEIDAAIADARREEEENSESRYKDAQQRAPRRTARRQRSGG